MTDRPRRPGECFAQGAGDLRCTEDADHRYPHYDATKDVAWTDPEEPA